MTTSIPRWLRGAVTGLALIVAVTVAITLLEPGAPALGLGVLYLLAVVPMALWYGVATAAAVSVLSMTAFNFFFLAPLHSLNPGTSEQWEVLLAFLVSSLLVSQLAARWQREARVSARLVDEQTALGRVATLVARGAPPPEVFGAVAREVGMLLGVGATHMARYGPDGTATVVAAWSSGGDHLPVGTDVRLGGDSVAGSVLRTRRPARMSSYEQASGAEGNLGRELGLRSSVGTPIVVDQRLWGVMIASSTSDRSLPAAAESRIAAFTDLSAMAIANAESRAGLAELAEEQAALRRVATLVARGAPPEEVFAMVAEEAAGLRPAAFATMCRYESDGTMSVVATSSSADRRFRVGARWSLGGTNVSTMVAQTGRSARIDGEVDAYTPRGGAVREPGFLSSVGTPITVEGRLWGVMMATSTQEQPLPTDTEERLVSFTELVATAIANAESRADLIASRARVVSAADETRRGIERDLHDGIQQRLVALGLEVRAVQTTVPAQLRELNLALSHIAAELGSLFEELLEISRGIHPAVLAEGGLQPALRALCRRSAVPVELDLRSGRRLLDRVEVATYYVVSEALTNVAKHARASVVNVELDSRGPILRLTIRDDGVGGADLRRGSGLVGVKDRIQALGGTLQIASPAGGGTTLRIEIPLDDASREMLP